MSAEPKWDYARFRHEIQELQAKVKSQEIAIADLRLDVDQHKIALLNAQQGIFKALTQNPHPWNKEFQKVWDEGVAKAEKARLKVDLKQTSRSNNVLWNMNVKQIPY